jgi:tetratricopeptide (TPR) repeat protein
MKQKLLRLIDESRRQESATLASRVDDSEPAAPGLWTGKDHLAHLMSWRQVAAQELRTARTGDALIEISSDDDVQNAKFYEATHGMRAGEVVDAARRSWDQLAEEIDKCSEENLVGPRPRYPEQKLWEVVPGNTYNHMPGHVASWLAEQGEDDQAERMAIWSHDVAAGSFPEDRTRAVATYNLGCFYAARGRTREALPHLARGIELRPDLREWARKDTDLDPIRSNAEVARLLAGS